MKIWIKGFWPLILIGGCNIYNPSLLDSNESAGSSGAPSGGNGMGGTGTMTGGKTDPPSAGSVVHMGGDDPIGGGPETGAGGDAPSVVSWLHVDGNKILREDGMPFRGRGVNIFDTRQCGACAWSDPGPVLSGVLKRIDLLTDEWGVTFLGLNLTSYASGMSGDLTLLQWKDVVDDMAYLDDIVTIVKHVGTKEGVYLLISIEDHPSLDERKLPTAATLPVWKKLSATFKDMPHVLYATAQSPFAPTTSEGWEAMNMVAETIRSEEDADKQHLIAAVGLQAQGNTLEPFLTKPLTAGAGKNIIYAVNVSAHPDGFNDLFLSPAKNLPVIIRSFSPNEDVNAVYMSADDCIALMTEAENVGIPYLATSFSASCFAAMLNFVPGNLDCASNPPLDPNAWGLMVKEHLTTPSPK